MSTKTLVGPKIITTLPGPMAKRIIDGDDRYVSPSYTRSYPLVAKTGRGIVVTDVDGNAWVRGAHLKPGDLVECEIVGAEEHDLIARPVSAL